MAARLQNFWDDCVFHVDYRTGLTTEWKGNRTASIAGGLPVFQNGCGGIGIYFDDTSYFTYGTDFTGFPSGAADRTFSALISYNAPDTYHGVFAYGDNAVNQSCSFSLTSSGYNNKLLGIHRTGGLLSSGTNGRLLEYPNRLIHAVWAYRDPELYIYVDGIRDPVPSTSWTLDTVPADPIQVGRSLGSSYWLGTIYTATLFNKYLSDEEIRVHTKEVCNNSRFLMSGR